MFSELNGKTLAKNQLVDWAIERDIRLSVEDVVERAIVAGATIVGKNSKKYYERMDEELKRENTITTEQLLAYCRQYGTGKEALKKIAEITGTKFRTIETYYYKWKIKDKLMAIQQTVPAPNKKEKKEKSQEVSAGETPKFDGLCIHDTLPITIPTNKACPEPFLKVTSMVGKVFDYQLIDGKIYPSDKTEDEYVVIYPEQLDDLIAELEELKNYVK